MSVPFNDMTRKYARYTEEIDSVSQRVLSSGRYILGPENDSLEAKLANYYGAAAVATVGSGTDALFLSLTALGIGTGDEVITVANTCTPTVAAIRLTGAVPVFVDIDNERLTMNPADIERCITKKTKVILPVHLYGVPADMGQIVTIAKKHGVLVVEDCAQSFGSLIGRVHAGLLGDVGCTSFYPTKNLGGFGDGGAVFSNNKSLIKKVRQLRMYGEVQRYESIAEGTNSRMDELQAGFVQWGLSHIDEWNQTRSDIAQTYLQGINNPLVQLPVDSSAQFQRVWHLFVVRVTDRNSFTKHLEEKSVGFGIHYPKLVYEQPVYEFLQVDPAQLPISSSIVDMVVSLPLYPELTEKEICQVIETVNSYGK